MNILEAINSNIKFQPGIIKYPTGKYGFVGSLPGELLQDLDTMRPKSLVFDDYNSAREHARKYGFVDIK